MQRFDCNFRYSPLTICQLGLEDLTEFACTQRHSNIHIEAVHVQIMHQDVDLCLSGHFTGLVDLLLDREL